MVNIDSFSDIIFVDSLPPAEDVEDIKAVYFVSKDSGQTGKFRCEYVCVEHIPGDRSSRTWEPIGSLV